MTDPLSTLLQQKKEAPTCSSTKETPLKTHGLFGFDVDATLGSKCSTSLFGDDSATVGEKIYKALAPGTNVDFPMITDICEYVSNRPNQVAEAVRLLHGAFAEVHGPARRKLKALTIMHELMYDKRAAAELREVHDARGDLWKLQTISNTGLGDKTDEQIRMFASEIEKSCFGALGDPSALTVPSSTPAPVLPRGVAFGGVDDPFAPLSPVADFGGIPSSFAVPPQQRKRDQAMDRLWQFGSAMGANLVAAAQNNLLQAGGSRPESVPRLMPQPEAARAELNITFDGILPGEKVHHVCNKAFLVTNNPLHETPGRLLVTSYRLKFQTPKGALRDELMWIAERQLLDLPHGLIEEARVENLTSETGAQEWRLRVATKDFRSLLFLLDNAQDLALVEEAVAALGQPGPSFTSCLFAFKHAVSCWDMGQSRNMDGWNIYDPFQEFGRMGVDTPTSSAPASPWVLSNANHKYALCDTYPAWLVLPRVVGANELRTVAGFRKRGRLPTMSWCSSSLSYASLWRSSQPTEGLLSRNACDEDERFIQAIRAGSLESSAGEPSKLLIVDLRQRKAAYANKVGGGGFEDYPCCRLVFGGIDNVHGVRDAWRKMGEAVAKLSSDEVGTWLRDVANSGWYDIIGAVIQCTCTVITELQVNRASALIHCSDGWDRTAQVSALAMLCLDPLYRTLSGFCVLIQKEFCCFGHRFRTRLGNGEKPSSEYSPIFLQWLECVYQLIVQFPTAFEFSSAFLLHLGKEAVTNRYGTFLTDTEMERTEKVMPYTLSFWSAVLSATADGPAPEHLNTTFQPVEDALHPCPSQVCFKIWEEYWFRYHIHPKQEQRPLP